MWDEEGELHVRDAAPLVAIASGRRKDLWYTPHHGHPHAMLHENDARKADGTMPTA